MDETNREPTMQTATDLGFDFFTLRGKTVEVKGIRIHGFSEALEVTPLVNAGKRGKTVEVVEVCGYTRNAGEWSNFLLELNQVEINDDFPNTVAKLGSERGFHVGQSTKKGVDVRPVAEVPVYVSTDEFSAKFGFEGFSVSDLTDRNNEPRYMSNERTGKRGIAKAFSLAKSGAFGACQTMHDVMGELAKNGIGGHYYCAMD